MEEKNEKLTSGMTTPTSGQYEIIGPRGGKTGREITAVQGTILPPVPKSGQTFVLVDKTRHKK